MYRPNQLERPFQDIQSQIRDLSQDFAIAFNTGNFDQAAMMFASEGVLMVPNYDAAYGEKAIERLLRQIGDQEYVGLRLETKRVEQSGDMAMEIGVFSAVARKKNLATRGKYVKVWRRLGAWRMIADCWSRTEEHTLISAA